MTERENKQLLTEDEAREKLIEGARDAFIAVSTSYGPKGRNVLYD